MSRSCSSCNQLGSLVDEQKTKIHLLETRLKDLVRAYKVVCKERDNFQAISSSITNDVDVGHQKRIAELEESVIQMSCLCGKLELNRKQDHDQFKELQEKYEHLSNELEQAKLAPKQLIVNVDPIIPKHVELRNNHTQTETIENEIEPPLVESVDKSTQTDNDQWPSCSLLCENKNENKTKNETAIVAPLLRNQQNSESEADCSSTQSFNDTINDNKMIGDQSLVSSGISLFHLNELARKELELADYRLRIREYECSLRELQWNYTNDKYKYQSRIADLEFLNKNLMATTNTNDRHHPHHDQQPQNTKPTNNINVAYIKNVLAKLIETKDNQQRKLMINVLITALDSMQTSN